MFKLHPKTKVLRKVDSINSKMLKGFFWRFPLPTELVITEPQLAVPYYARYWQLRKWIHEGKEVDYDTLRKLPDFTGTSSYPCVFLVEHWENYGSDGHTECTFQSWYEITSLYNEKLDYEKVSLAVRYFEDEQK